MQSLETKGVCPEADYPYHIVNYRKKPSDIAYQNARSHIIKNTSSVKTNSVSFKISLSNGFPVVFGFNVYDSFQTFDVAKNGIMPMPVFGEKILGGHAVLAVGYDDNMKSKGYTGFFLVRNSWGSAWGLNGYFWMPYDFVNRSEDCADSWIIGGRDEEDDSSNSEEESEETEQTEEYISDCECDYVCDCPCNQENIDNNKQKID